MVANILDREHTAITYTVMLTCAGEITRIALRQGLVQPSGKTPEATMASALYVDVKRKEGQSIFIRPHEGLFGLRAWLEEGLIFKVRSDQTLYPVERWLQPTLLGNSVLLKPAASVAMRPAVPAKNPPAGRTRFCLPNLLHVWAAFDPTSDSFLLCSPTDRRTQVLSRQRSAHAAQRPSPGAVPRGRAA